MLARIKFESGKSFFFTYQGRRIHFKNMRWNRFLVGWVVDYFEEGDGGVTLNGMPIRGGVNLLQGTAAYLPSLYAVNKADVTLDPERSVEFELYVYIP